MHPRGRAGSRAQDLTIHQHSESAIVWWMLNAMAESVPPRRAGYPVPYRRSICSNGRAREARILTCAAIALATRSKASRWGDASG